jgi:hypothetical protein
MYFAITSPIHGENREMGVTLRNGTISFLRQAMEGEKNVLYEIELVKKENVGYPLTETEYDGVTPEQKLFALINKFKE